MKRHMSLSRLMLLFLLIFTVLLAGMVGVFLRSFTVQSRREEAQYLSRALEETARLISQDVLNMTRAMEELAWNGDFGEFCVGSPALRNEEQDSIRMLFVLFMMDHPAVTQITLFALDGAYFASSAYTLENRYILYQRLDKELDFSSISRQSLYSAPHIDPPENDGKYYFEIVTPVYETRVNRTRAALGGILIAQIDVSAILDAQNVTNKGLMMRAADVTMYASGARADAEAGVHIIGTGERIDMGKHYWELFVIGAPSALSPSTVKGMQYTLFGGVIMLFLHSLSMLALYQLVVKPITRLSEDVRIASGKGVHLNPRLDRRNELVRLTNSINEMVERIQKMNEEQAAHLRDRAIFMQARINPHFLYNNLECIRGMAALKDFGAVRDMAGIMADIYRYCNQSEPLVPLSQELACLEKYMRIYTLRYGEGFELSIRADEQARAFKVPRMTLQPLMENSLCHGFLAAKRGEGNIWLSAEANMGGLTIRITDDGIGMDDETLKRVNMDTDTIQEQNAKHLGVANVRMRLRMLYGEKSLLRFSGAQGGGVCALIFLPVCAEDIKIVQKLI